MPVVVDLLHVTTPRHVANKVMTMTIPRLGAALRHAAPRRAAPHGVYGQEGAM